jgi:transketolase
MSGFATRPYATAIADYAQTRPDVVCLSGDLTTSCEVDLFRDRFPERFFNVGMAEQNMMGIAGGLARGGLVPFVHTFGVFATRRPLDQVSMAIGVPSLPVRIMGFLPGVTTPGGVTHQAIDDAALMRAVPRMTVVDLGDATEIETVLPELDDVDGPVYCRVMRGDVPRLFAEPFVLGRVRVLSVGTDLCIVSASITTQEAITATAALAAAGVSVTHLHASTLKPFDDPVVLESVDRSRGVITLENHLVTGGLGSAVAEAIAGAGLGTRLVRLGLQDTYAAGGSPPYLLRRFSMDADAVVAAAEQLLDERLARPVDPVTVIAAGDLTRQEAL